MLTPPFPFEVEMQGDWRFLLIGLPFAILVWWIARQLDEVRIIKYGDARGWRFEEISYEFFGSGSNGDECGRYYSVRYVDEFGVVHSAGCRTSSSLGVYFTNDQRLGFAPTPARTGPAIDCPRCGMLIDQFHTACPNCGTARPPPEGNGSRKK